MKPRGTIRQSTAFKHLLLIAVFVPAASVAVDVLLFLVHLRDATSIFFVTATSVVGCSMMFWVAWRKISGLAATYKSAVQQSAMLEDAMREQLEAESEARARAEEATRVRDNLLSVASHDLKNPLGTLYFATQMMQRAVRENPEARLQDTELAKFADMSVRQVRHMLRLIDDLMNVSHITSGKVSVELEDVDVAASIGEVVSRMRDTVERAGCTLRMDVSGPVYAVADQGKLDQVLVNVLSNACKYGQGQPIDLRLKAGAGRVRVSVADRGIGISPEDQTRIFDKFERAVPGRKFVGHGLGLWIVRNLLENMGGSVTVESRPGEGSTFHIDLKPSSIKTSGAFRVYDAG